MNTIIKNGKIILHDKIVEDHYLRIENRVIKEISKNYDEHKNYDIIKTVTLNPAKLLSANNEVGSIEIGKKADIVIFDDDYHIKKVILS